MRGEGKYSVTKESELPKDPRGPVWRVSVEEKREKGL